MAHDHSQLFMFGSPSPPATPETRPSAFLRNSLLRIADPLELNPAQLQVVTAPFGPILVIAGAGSGKTKVLTRRAAWYIAHGIPPKQILSITFTRKAAHEMLSRVQDINPLPKHQIDGGTFHSKAHHWLRLFGSAIGLSSRFTIMDEGDSTGMLHLLASKQRLTGIKGFPDKRTLLMLFGHAANSMTPIAETIETVGPHFQSHTTQIVALHRLFTDTKWTQQRFDYDDLLLMIHRLFMEDPDTAVRLAHSYRAILVDEYQDSTRLQAELVRLLGAPHHNVMVVGDDCQCLREGTPVLTPMGYRPVESLQVGDTVLSAAGCGRIAPCPITQTSFSYPRDFIRITTSKGHTVDVSPQHVCFAKVNTSRPCWYVYLMYREGLGYRIGVTSVTKRYRNSNLRSSRERADKLWFLKSCQSRYEAQYFETLWSLRYQIPQTLYAPEKHTESARMTNAHSATLFREFGSNGYRLLKDFGLEFENPTYAPKASRSRNRIAINVIQCHSSSQMNRGEKPKHLLVAESRLGCHVASQFPNCTVKGHYWRIRVQSANYRDLLDQARRLQSALCREKYNAIVIEKAHFLKGHQSNTSLFLPIQAAGLVLGMTIPILEDDTIHTDTITRLERLPNENSERFYDLEVEHAHNIITNSIVTHNSIYSFRSADVRNMQDFPRLFPNVTLYKLEQNYRSTKSILTVANTIVSQAQHLHPKQLFTTKPDGRRPQLIECPDEPVQSEYVVDQLLALQQQGVGLHRIAILFRLSAHSYQLETALTRHRIPFVKYGGLALVETAHVKDFLAYLTVTVRPTDRPSWQRLLLLLDRVGPATAEELITRINAATHPLDVLHHDTSPARQDLQALAQVLTQLSDPAVPLGLRLQAVLDHYQAYLKRHYPDDMADRLSELSFLVQSHATIPSIQELVDALVGTGFSDPTQTRAHPDDTLVLSTIHSAKGLEWDAVFVLNASDGRLPHSRSLKDPRTLEEERRLLYVAITRPRHLLVITYPTDPGTKGNSQVSGKCSRFLDLLDDATIDRIQLM